MILPRGWPHVKRFFDDEFRSLPASPLSINRTIPRWGNGPKRQKDEKWTAEDSAHAESNFGLPTANWQPPTDNLQRQLTSVLVFDLQPVNEAAAVRSAPKQDAIDAESEEVRAAGDIPFL